MLPRGFLGTRADVLIDVIIISILIILPILFVSFTRARSGQYELHRNIQVSLGSTLAVVVALFELDLRLSGGILKLTEESRYAGTLVLSGSIYLHLMFSVSTALIWTWLLLTSLRRFKRPPTPGPFSRAHRFWGRVGMIDMALTGLTGLELYVIGFVL